VGKRDRASVDAKHVTEGATPHAEHRRVRILPRLSLLVMLLVLSAALGSLATSTASAANTEVLVVSRGETAAGAGLTSSLQRLKYTTVESKTVPSELSAYKAVWVVIAGSGLLPDEEQTLEDYLKGGGSVYLTGAAPGGNQELTASDERIAGAVLTNNNFWENHMVNEPGHFNPAAKDGVTQTPHHLEKFLAGPPEGGLSQVGILSDENALAYGEGGEIVVAAVFDESDMKNERGRLVIYMDLAYLEPGSELLARRSAARAHTVIPAVTPEPEESWLVTEKARLEVVENIQDFLGNTPERDELPEEGPPHPGNVLVLTSEAPLNLQAGLDTTAELRSLRYDVTLSVAPSITLAKPRPSSSQHPTPWKMPKLKDYSAVWLLAEGAQDLDREAVEHYVARGGHLYLGGNHVTWPSNEADRDLLRYLLSNEQITIHDSISEGASQFAPGALDGLTQTPSSLSAMPIHSIAEISGLEARNVLATHGEVATAAAFDEADMNSRRGRLVIYPDDWTQADTDATTRGGFVQNVQDFLEATPQRIAPRSAEYVALGDSYASGLGSYEYVAGTTGKDGCYKASWGYAKEIAAKDHMTLSFRSCNGDQIGGIWAGTGERQPQINAVGLDTRAITLTVGGDDMGFAGVIKSCILPVHLSLKHPFACHTKLEGPAAEAEGWLRRGRQAGKYKRPGGDKSRNENWQPGLRQLYESILYQAPGAELVVIGYPLLMESEIPEGFAYPCDVTFPSPHSLPLTARPSDVEWINKATDDVDQIIQNAVEETRAATGRNIRFADPRPAFHGHALCDPSLNQYINMLHFELEPGEILTHIKKPELEAILNKEPESIHPDIEGQEALRELIEETAQEFER
jgi:hypothetical protein